MERWPMLSLRKGDALAQPRANAVNTENISEYYSLLEKTLKKHGLFNCPSRLYNMDESGMPLDHKPPKVIVLREFIVVRLETKLKYLFSLVLMLLAM